MAVNNQNDNKLVVNIALSAAVITVFAMIILLNYYYTEKLNRISAATSDNINRITKIENFLNQQINAAMKQQQQKEAPVDTKESK